jgi:hypothetical protein
MAQQHLNTGSVASDGTGDTLREAFIKTEENFIDLYDIRGPSYFPDYTGSLIMTSSEGQTSPLLQLTGSLQVSLTSSVTTANVGVDTISTSNIGYIVNNPPLLSNIGATYPHFQFRESGDTVYIYPKGSGGFVRFLSNRVDFGFGNTTPCNFSVKNQNSSNIIETNSFRLGILTTPSYVLDVNGDIQASEYFFFQSPTPASGDFQSKSSDTIFGDGGSIQILCQV